MHKNEIIISLSGPKLKPEGLRGKELGSFLESFDELVSSRLNYITNGEEKIVFGTTSITDGSIKIGFSSKSMSLLVSLYVGIAGCINSKNFDALDTAQRESLRKMVSFSARNNCEIQLLEYPNNKFVVARLTPGMSIPEVELFSGNAVIYGKVIRVGGKEPKLMLEKDTGENLYCSISQELAVRMGRKLYAQIGARGIAKWDPYTLTMQEFEILEITEYEEMSIATAVKKFNENFGQYYSDIHDPDVYIKEMRS